MAENDLISIFRVEVGEYLESLNSNLLQIEMAAETESTYRPTLIEMNRLVHSMKGAARAVGIQLIETIAHYMEEVFSAAMKNRLHLTPDICDMLYDGLDLIQNVMDNEETPDEVVSEVLARLEQTVAKSTSTDSQQVAIVPIVESQQADETDDDFDEDDQILIIPKDNLPQPSKKSVHKPPAPLPTPSSSGKAKTTQTTPLVPSSASYHPPERATSTLSMTPHVETLALRPAEETVRITVNKLDRLMSEATELLVVRMHSDEHHRSVNELRRILNRWQREWRSVRSSYIRLVRGIQDKQEIISPELTVLLKFVETNQRFMTELARRLTQLAQTMALDNMHLATLTEQLQDDISRMRLIPFDAIVGSLQRMVRDIAREMDKQIQLDISGAAVEIDKTVLDTLKDPLMHLIRNAVDHGIGTPQEREDAGKPPVGLIQIDVEQRGSEIVIAVRDDGHGIDLTRVRQMLVRRKLLSEAEAQALSDEEAQFFIFHPGFSTRDKVTAVSGRGLGMDIVRDRVESLRGRVSVRSMVGDGTTVTMNVPVSLTRIRCILLRVGDQTFAVPSTVVIRMQNISRQDIFTAEGQEVIIVNGQPTPCISLGAILDIPMVKTLGDTVDLLIIQAASRMIAFEVDELISEIELVLKPLGPELAQARLLSGAALLGTGEVVLMLEPNNLVRAATGTAIPRRRAMTNPTGETQQRTRVLVVDDSITTRTLEKNILETAGFDVQVAIDGLEAWGMLHNMPFDLVISDIEMPKMNGLELTAMIKQSPQMRHLPVILLTSLSKPEQREAGLRAGADGYLVKSQFDQNELLQAIQAFV